MYDRAAFHGFFLLWSRKIMVYQITEDFGLACKQITMNLEGDPLVRDQYDISKPKPIILGLLNIVYANE